MAQLERSSASVVLVCAPSGYGKSVLIGHWAERDPRPFPTVILGAEHNDAALLVAAIIAALDLVEPVPPEVQAALANPRPSMANVVLPRLRRALDQRKLPFVLVFDDFERIESPQALEVISVIIGTFRRGSKLVLVTRTEPALPIGRLRAHRELTELTSQDLKMRRSECKELLLAIGLELSSQQLNTVVARTEGWPAAVYLAGMALIDAPDLATAIARFAGDDRFIVDYISDAFLGAMSPQRLDFLRRASVLDRLSGDLCDVVLQQRGSATELRDLSHSNIMLTPLDRRDEWFRFHPLFREMLRAELRRAAPEQEAELNRRASEWWTAAGDWDRAITHAVDAGALDRAGELLYTGIPELTTRGRNATVMGWLDRIGEQTVSTDAALSLTSAYAHITQGDGTRTEHWAAVAAGLLAAEEPSARRAGLEAGLALIEATLARGGVAGISNRAALAAELLPDDSPWMSLCRLIEGVGLHLRGLREEAHEKLIDGARRGAIGAPNVQVLCLSQLALLAIEDGDWTLGDMLASQARAQIDRSGLIDYPMMALSLAVSALVRSRTGRLVGAAADLRQGTKLLEQLEDFPPWYEAETWVALSRTAARLNDPPTATRMLGEASRTLELTPDAVVLEEWVAETALSIETLSASPAHGLTPAELRVLQFLPTHLSYPQIAGEVLLSTNTVKSQAASVYRKLGVTSRRDAVAQAQAAGLLDPGRVS